MSVSPALHNFHFSCAKSALPAGPAPPPALLELPERRLRSRRSPAPPGSGHCQPTDMLHHPRHPYIRTETRPSEGVDVEAKAPLWPNHRRTNPSQGGQYCGITPLEEGVAPARGPTICEARLYAVPLPPWHRPVAPQYVRPHFMWCRSPPTL